MTEDPPGTLKPLDYYLEGIYETEVIEEDGPDGTIYVARLKNCPGCLSQASSADMALENLEHFKNTLIRSRYERGVPPPEPDHHKDVDLRSVRGTLVGKLRR